MKYITESGDVLHIMQYGIGWLESRNIYFGFKCTPVGIITTLENLHIKSISKETLNIDGTTYSLVTMGSLENERNLLSYDQEIKGLPVSEELKSFARSNIARMLADRGSQQYAAAKKRMQEMIKEAEEKGIEVPDKARFMMREVNCFGESDT